MTLKSLSTFGLQKFTRELVFISSLLFFPISSYQSTYNITESEVSIITSINNITSDISRKSLYTIAQTVDYISKAENIKPSLILAIIHTESNFKHNIDNGYGTGLMQIVSSAHNIKKKILLDPTQNIIIGTRIYKECREKSKSDKEALARYNGTWKLQAGVVYSRKVLASQRLFEINLHKS